jgi:hypothetical protein
VGKEVPMMEGTVSKFEEQGTVDEYVVPSAL